MNPIEQRQTAPADGPRFRRFAEPALRPPTGEGKITIEDNRAVGATLDRDDLRQLTAQTAHDFNNLLSVILACASELEEGPTDGFEVCERALEIRGAAERGARLTRELIDAVKPRAQKTEPTDLNPAVLDSLAMIRRMAGDPIAVECRLGAELPSVGVDRARIEQMLLNLASNARDATRGRGSLTISTCLLSIAAGDPRLGPGWYVRLSVSDDGVGMTRDVIEQAVEPFYTTKAGENGTGLGLPTVAGIARSAGGDLRIGSIPGVGTTVSVHLPAIAVSGNALALLPRGRRGGSRPAGV
jgi:signal transduction histidine kinase